MLAKGVLEYLQLEGILSRLASQNPVPLAQKLKSFPKCRGSTGVGLAFDFFYYQFAEGEPYLRVQGPGFEFDQGRFEVLKGVYVLIGEDYFSALSKLPLRVIMPDGNIPAFNGWYALDVPVKSVNKPVLREILAVTRAGCLKSRPIEPGLQPEKRMPPVISRPPTMHFDFLVRLGS